MRAFLFGLLFSSITVFAFDPLQYISKEHDKLYFGIGGGMISGLSESYTKFFPDYSFKMILLQAGVGDYPFVADIRYCQTWMDGFAPGLVSGTGASLTEYEICGGLRTYLFWKNNHVKQYLLTAILSEQEEMVSSTAAGKDNFDFTNGVSYGFRVGVGVDFFFADYSFVDIEVAVKNVNSEFFAQKEMLTINILYNVGK